jgi:hypothetical protein
VSRLAFRVWPHDLDTSLHMNNGRYWTIHWISGAAPTFMIRSGPLALHTSFARKWTPVVQRRPRKSASGARAEAVPRLPPRGRVSLIAWGDTVARGWSHRHR